MTQQLSGILHVEGYSIRRLSRADAAGVTRLVELVYQDSYYPRILYDPDQIVRLNEEGNLVSIVALDSTGEVVGHYALERPHAIPIAEASDAIVLPDHRHHHLMEQMRVMLRDEAIRLGLAGLVGYPVTNHLYSQLAEDHFGSHPCGLAVGMWPQTFHNMPEALPQRMSFVIYFKYLRQPGRVAHVATRHQELIARIYCQFDIVVDLLPEESAHGPGEIAVEYEAAVETGTIRVRRVGADTLAAVEQACSDLVKKAGARSLNLELPLAQPATSELSRRCEDLGFFFCGLGPSFAGDGDALLLQRPEEAINLDLLQIDHPFSKEILAYVGSERDRVRRANLLASS